MSPLTHQPADADRVRYFLSWDRKTQIAAVMTDDLHRVVWGRMSFANRPYEGVVLVEALDARAWIDGQMQARADEAQAQRARIGQPVRMAEAA